jgi:hypothetical protein
MSLAPRRIVGGELREVVVLGKHRAIGGAVGALALAAAALALTAGPAGAVSVSNEAQLRAAFLDSAETEVVLTADIDLTDCGAGHVLRLGGAAPLVVSGGFTIRQTCPNLRVIGSAAATGALTVDGATITGGRLTGDPTATGGGIFWQGDLTLDGATVTDNTVTAPVSALAGGVFASGALVVRDSVVSGNSALSNGDFGALGGATVANGESLIVDSLVSGNTAGGGADFGGTGGAIFGNGNATVLRSTFSGNTAGASEGASSGNGGAIVINAALTVVNSTVVGNVAEGATSNNGGLGSGGDMTLLYSTVVGNSAATSANLQGLSSNPEFSEDEVFGSVIADPQGGGANCGVSDIASTGFNVSDDTSCSLLTPGDQQGVADVGLGALGDNGGPTPTMLPQAGSVLLDLIPAASCRLADDGVDGTDQRGITRPQGAGCDVGAVEVFVQVPTTTSTTTTTVPGQPPAAQPVPAEPTFTG